MRNRLHKAPVRKPDDKRPTNGATDDGDDGDDVIDRICLTLANAISQGALKPGEKVIEDTIADHFGVSRTVVRGALGILQRDHLLERKRNRGTFVAAPSVEEARQLFEARRLVEGAILDSMALRVDADAVARLEQLIDDEHRIHAQGDQPTKTALSGQFHVVLAECCGNAVLTESLGKVIARISLVMALYQTEPGDQCGADHHRDIVRAIAEGDFARAKSLMDYHLADLESRVRLEAPAPDRNSFAEVLQTFSVK